MSQPQDTFFSWFAKKNAWLYIFSFIIAPAGYLVRGILSWDLSPAEIGVFYSIISFVTIISAYNGLGMTESLNYFLPGFIQEKNISRITQSVVYALSVQIIMSLLVVGGLFFLTDTLVLHYFESPWVWNVLKVFYIFFFAENIFNTFHVFFQAAHNTFQQKMVEFARMWSVAIFVIIIWKTWSSDLQVYAWGWVLGLFMGIILSFYYLVTSYRDLFAWKELSWDRSYFSQMMKYSGWSMITKGIGTLLSQMDQQMVLVILGAVSAGYYSNYLAIIRIPFIFLLPAVGFLFPVISSLAKKSDISRISQIRSLMYKYFSVLGVIIGIWLIIFGKGLVVFLFGHEYIPSASILLYSGGFLFLNFLLQIDFQILSGVGKVHKKAFIFLGALVLNFILNLVFIKWLGVGGAALATGCGWVFIWFMAQRENRDIPLRFDVGFFLKNLSVYLVVSAGYLSFFEMPEFTRLSAFIYTLGSAAVLGIIFILLNISDLKRAYISIKWGK